MRKEAEKESTKLNENPNNIFALVRFMKKDGKILKEVDACEEKMEGLVSVKKTGKEYGKIIWR